MQVYTGSDTSSVEARGLASKTKLNAPPSAFSGSATGTFRLKDCLVCSLWFSMYMYGFLPQVIVTAQLHAWCVCVCVCVCGVCVWGGGGGGGGRLLSIVYTLGDITLTTFRCGEARLEGGGDSGMGGLVTGTSPKSILPVAEDPV